MVTASGSAAQGQAVPCGPRPLTLAGADVRLAAERWDHLAAYRQPAGGRWVGRVGIDA